MTIQYSWDYSPDSDILNVHAKGKKVKGSAELGEFTFDFDSDENIIGLEITNIAEIFNELINKEQLSEISGAKIALVTRGNATYALLYLKLPKREQIIEITAPPLIAAR